MASADTSSSKLPKLTRASNWDVWSAQFTEYVRQKGVVRWLTNEPTASDAGAESGDATCKGHMILSTSVVALIRLIQNASTAKAAWAALKEDFLGRDRVRRHEINRESKDFRQKKGESFTSYCDRAADHYAKVEAVGGGTVQFADDFILGLAEPFRSNNSARLTNVVDDKGFEALISEVRQSSRLCIGDHSRDGSALAAGGGGRQFKGKCHYCDKPGHKKVDCRRRKYDERMGNLKPDAKSSTVPKPEVPQRPAAAMVCEGVAMAVSANSTHDAVLYDSCCTHHVVTDRMYLAHFTSTSDVRYMRMGGNEKHPVLGQGTAVLVGGPEGEIVLRNALYVPTMIHNLVSSGAVARAGHKTLTDASSILIMRRTDDAVILTGNYDGGMAQLSVQWKVLTLPDGTQQESSDSDASEAQSDDEECGGCAMAAGGGTAVSLFRAHERLGHLNMPQIKKLANGDAVKGLQLSDAALDTDACVTCAAAKQTRTSFPPSESRASKPLELVHMDTVGPIQQQGYDGSRYAIPVHDDYSSYSDVICVRGKDQIAEAVIELLTFWQRQTGFLVLTIRSDNGTEFKGELDVWCAQHGVRREYSAPYTPEQNGRSERMNRTYIEFGRALLLQRDCAKKFWPLAYKTVSFIRNRVTVATQPYTPLEYFLRKIPDLSMLRVFGCSASLSIPKRKRDGKLGAVSASGVFVGYSDGSKGYCVAVGNTIHVSPNVVFRENVRGDFSTRQIDIAGDSGSGSDSDSDSEVDVAAGGPMHMHDAALPADPHHLLAPVPLGNAEGGTDAESMGDTQAEYSGVHDGDPAAVAEVAQEEAAPPRRSSRSRNPPTHYIPGTALSSEAVSGLEELYMQDAALHEGSAFAVTGQTVPKNYADIANWGDMQDLWYKSYNREMTSIKEMGVIEELAEKDIPEGVRTLTSKLDFCNKYGPNGEITDRKTRLCVHGFKQVEGIDYHETTAPTAAANTTRLFFAAAAHYDWHIHQMDVKTAFLHAPLEEELYMRPPPGIPELKGKIWRLHKAIYGLKQAANAWYAKLSHDLQQIGFKPCLTDPCLFIKDSRGTRTVLLVYVDDMLLGGKLSDVLLAKQHVAQCFKTKDLGVAYHFLGFLIHRDQHGIRLSQEQYTNVVLERFGFQKAHGKRTPFNEGTAKECAVRCQCESAEKKLVSFRSVAHECKCKPYDSDIDFAAFVGAVMFLATRSRPDISYEVGVLSRFVSAPMAFHDPMVRHLLRYLVSTIDWGLWYPSGQYLRDCSGSAAAQRRSGAVAHMLLYTDSDHCGEEKMRSTSGWVVQVFGCTVAWGSKLQPTPVESTCAAEFVAACMGENAVMGLKDLLFEMTGKTVDAELLVDNQSAVGKLIRPAGGNMWLDLKWRVVHQRHVDKLVSIRYIPTTEQKADVFTKCLTPAKHEEAVSMLSMYCDELKSAECDSAEECSALRRNGVQVPLKKHTCIYKGAKQCTTCMKFYEGFK